MPLDAFGNPVGPSAAPLPTPVAASPGPQFAEESPLAGVAPVVSGVLGTFVLGIVSLWLSFLGPWAWIRGSRLVRQIDESQRPDAGRGLAVAAKVMGIIATFFLTMQILGIVVVIATGS